MAAAAAVGAAVVVAAVVAQQPRTKAGAATSEGGEELPGSLAAFGRNIDELRAELGVQRLDVAEPAAAPGGVG